MNKKWCRRGSKSTSKTKEKNGKKFTTQNNQFKNINPEKQKQSRKQNMKTIITISITSSKPLLIHDKIAVKLKQLPQYCLCENIRVLERSRYVDHRICFPADQFPDKRVSYIDVLGVWVGDSVLCKHHCTSIVFEHRNAWHPNTRRHKTLNLPKKQCRLNDVRKCD